MYDAPVGGDHLGSEQVVRGVTEHSLEPAAARPERQARNARGRDATARRGEPVRLRCGVELAPGHARLRPRDARLRIDVDPLHGREVEHDPVVTDGVAVDAMAAAPDGER